MTKTSIFVSLDDHWLIIKKKTKDDERIKTPNGPLDLFVDLRKDKEQVSERYTGIAVRTVGLVEVLTERVRREANVQRSVLFLDTQKEEVTYYSHDHEARHAEQSVRLGDGAITLYLSKEGYVIGFKATVPEDIVGQLMLVAKTAA